MSGGSMEYLCFKVEEEAEKLLEDKVMLRRAFGRHLEKVAKALHDIEWVDSDDKSPGDEFEAIKAIFGDKNTSVMELKETLLEAKMVYEALCISALKVAEFLKFAASKPDGTMQ